MRTNIDIDDELIAEVMRVTGTTTKKAAVDEALMRVAKTYRLRKVMDELRGSGWDGDLDEMRGGKTLVEKEVIVVDSSVFVADLRDEPTAATRFMRALEAEHELIIGDLVALEVLQGMDDERKSALLEDALVNYGLTAMLDEAVAIAAARNLRQLRRRGITLRKTPDLIIATFCMVHGHHLLHQDRDFDHFEKLLGLKVFRPH